MSAAAGEEFVLRVQVGILMDRDQVLRALSKGCFSMIAATLLFVVLTTNALAKDENGEIDNLAGEYAECAAYFQLVYAAVKKSGEKDLAKVYDDAASRAALVSWFLASELRSFPAAMEVTQARIKMYTEQMRIEAHNNNANLSILIAKYQTKCLDLLNDPPEKIPELAQ